MCSMMLEEGQHKKLRTLHRNMVTTSKSSFMELILIMIEMVIVVDVSCGLWTLAVCNHSRIGNVLA